ALIRRSTPSTSVDLPQPDSPANPNTSLRLIVTSTPSTTLASPATVLYQMRASLMRIRSSDGAPAVECALLFNTAGAGLLPCDILQPRVEILFHAAVDHGERQENQDEDSRWQEQ